METCKAEAETAAGPSKFEAALLARDDLRSDEGLERSGDTGGQRLGIDAHRGDDEGLADIRASLFVDNLDELGLEVAARGRIGHLQDLLHPVVETFRRAVEEHQRGVAGDELEIVRFDAAAAERDPLGRDWNKTKIEPFCVYRKTTSVIAVFGC